MLQYKVFFRRAGSPKFSELEPGVHAKLYDRPEIQAAVNHIFCTPEVEGIALRVGDEQFNVIAFEQDTLATNAFVFLHGPPNGKACQFEAVAEGDVVRKTLA